MDRTHHQDSEDIEIDNYMGKDDYCRIIFQLENKVKALSEELIASSHYYQMIQYENESLTNKLLQAGSQGGKKSGFIAGKEYEIDLDVTIPSMKESNGEFLHITEGTGFLKPRNEFSMSRADEILSDYEKLDESWERLKSNPNMIYKLKELCDRFAHELRPRNKVKYNIPTSDAKTEKI